MKLDLLKWFTYVPEDTANKDNTTSLGSSATLFPTQNAAKQYHDLFFNIRAEQKVFSREQLSKSPTKGIFPAEPIIFTDPPADGETIIIKNAAGTKTYKFMNTPSDPNYDVQIGGSGPASINNFVSKVNANYGSDVYKAILVPGLFGSNYTVLIIDTTDVSSASTARIYGTSPAWVAPMNGLLEYVNNLAYRTAMPGTDPGVSNFGISLVSSEMNEVHYSIGDGIYYLISWSSGCWEIAIGNVFTTISDSATLDETYKTVICDKSSAMAVTLPNPTTSAGRRYDIKNINTGTVTVTATIDGATNYDLAQWESLTVISDGSQWLIL
jgi:hypothetical protein